MSAYDDYLAAVSRAESGGNPNIRNRAGSGAQGLYQIMPGVQEGLRRQGFSVDMSTPEGQTAAASELTRQNDILLRTRLGREPTNAERYFAHGFGGPAAAHLLAHPDQPLGQSLREFYAGTRQGPGFADRVFQQNSNLQPLWDQPVSATVADFGTRLDRGGSAPRGSSAPGAPPAAAPVADGVQAKAGGGTLDAATIIRLAQAPEDPNGPMSDFGPMINPSAGQQVAQAPQPLPPAGTPPAGMPGGFSPRALPGDTSAPLPQPGVVPDLPPLPQMIAPPGPYAGAVPPQPMPPAPAQPGRFSAPGIRMVTPPAPMPTPATPQSLLDARRREQDRAQTAPYVTPPTPPGTPSGAEGAVQALDAAVPRFGPQAPSLDPAVSGAGAAATPDSGGVMGWLRGLFGPSRTPEERIAGREAAQGAAAQPPQSQAYVAGPGSAALPRPPTAPAGPAGPALPTAPTVAPLQMPPQPDYARILDLMQRASNPERANRGTSSERTWEAVLAGLGAGGVRQPGDTIGSVIGRAGQGAAQGRLAGTREDRAAEERYQQARSEAFARTGQLGLTMTGQQQQAGATALQAQQHNQMMQYQQFNTQMALYNAHLNLIRATRQTPLGRPAQDALIQRLQAAGIPAAVQQAQRMPGFAALPPSEQSRIIQSLAMQHVMSTPEGVSAWRSMNTDLRAQPAQPGAAPTE